MYSFLFFPILKKTKRGYARRVKIELNQELQTWRSGFKYYKRSWPIKALGYGYDISTSVFVHWMYSWSFPVTPKQSKTKNTFDSSTNNCVPSHRLFFIPKGKLRKKKPQELSQKL